MTPEERIEAALSAVPNTTPGPWIDDNPYILNHDRYRTIATVRELRLGADKEICALAYDLYNSQDDCLLEK